MRFPHGSRGSSTRPERLARFSGARRNVSRSWLRLRRPPRGCSRGGRYWNRNRQPDGRSGHRSQTHRVSRRYSNPRRWGNAESLPLADESLDGVVMYDVIEHIERPSAALAEVSRVIRQGGVLACRTPNRYSFAAEPHVFVWGVGWLPRRYQQGFIRRRSGRAYPQTWLLSAAELRGIIQRYTGFDAVITAPPIADYELETFSEPRATVARIYNMFTRWPWARHVLLRIGPLFQTIATKRRDNPPAR
ncbi:MAG TPA: class I SAM-dependent methyltransferase [Gemmatimonadaceae bacterium]|nr:class I SAM-dependent methyltransferase [Gemmatimonadaceae bacterium]